MQLTTKILLSLAVLICLFFLGIYLVNYFQIQNAFVGAVFQLFIIPAMIAQLVVLGFSILTIMKQPQQKWCWVSLVLMSITSTLTIGSFFM
jgi:hypothetical protein